MKHWVLVASMFLSLAASAQQDPIIEDKPLAPVPQAPEKGPMVTTKSAIHDGVEFLEPKDGAVVTSPFKVRFGVHGMRVQPAGTIEIGTGHHHIIIRPVGKGVKKKHALAEKAVVPADETHIHFGKGQEETELTLKPGKYFLTLQFADGAHLSYGPAWSRTIAVTVK